MSKEQLKQLEKKYNINLDVQTKIGEKTYWDLREYFTKEIEDENILICKDYGTQCCHRTDIKAMREEFEEKLNEFTEWESKEVCTDPDIERAMGESCQYATNISNNEFETTQQEPHPSYN